MLGGLTTLWALAAIAKLQLLRLSAVVHAISGHVTTIVARALYGIIAAKNNNKRQLEF